MNNALLGASSRFALPAFAGVFAASGVFAPAVYAQSSSEDATAESIGNVIVVTARKRAESIQDTPIAVTAFDNAEIESAGYESVLDIAQATPGLNIESFNSAPGRLDTQPRFRGVVFDAAGEPLSRTGLTLIDGIVVTGGIQGIGVGELERVEVIKGPQSAQFGRNSFSGAINYITKDPADEFGVNATFLAATRDEYRASVSVEGPIIPEILNFRLNGSYNYNGGHFTNTAVPGQELGTEETWAISGALLFQPTDKLKFKIRSRYYQDNDGPAAIQATAGVIQHNFGGFPVANGVTDRTAPFAGVPTSGELAANTRTETAFRGRVSQPALASIGLNTSQAVFDTIVSNTGNMGQTDFLSDLGISLNELGGFGIRREAFRIGGAMEYEFGDNLRFDALFGYNDEAVLGVFDFDGTTDASFVSASGTSIEDISAEIRVSGSLWDERVNWSLGGNYYKADVISDGGFGFGSGGLFGGFLDSPSENSARTLGVFGTLDVEIIDGLTVSLEGRYQGDRISEPGANSTVAGAAPISPSTFNKFLPRVVVSYEPTDNTLLYANYSIGNLPGGFNDTIAELDATELAAVRALAPGADVVFDEEELENYEIGWKQTTSDGNFSFNVAAFYMKRSDEIFTNVVQILDNSTMPPGVQTITFTDNGASTRIYGFELDWTARPIENLTFQGSFAYVNSEIESFPATSDAGDFNDIFGDEANVAGQEAPRFPPITASLSAIYTQPVDMGFFDEIFVRADGFFTSSYFDSNANLTEIDDRLDVNLRAGLGGENYRIEFFVTNLLGEDTPTSINNIADTSSNTGLFDFRREGSQIALHPRRQFGVRTSFNF
ncbi:TonB-dependent receptor [Sphingorhabdus sp. EL138]|uniref:TonB-dependent receptor n=1 Tax=Sphingorhabdus sp. EL138 TaxID=2073156 RepID=UPI0013A53A0B|nr:TonB-dependent receptor [Sphingorhabdus sp. EL138]